MKCPICKKGEVAYCYDAIISRKISKTKSGIKVSKVLDINHLDECWIECNNCLATSNEEDGQFSEELKELMAEQTQYEF